MTETTTETTSSPMTGLRDAVASVAGDDRSGWSGVARSELLTELLDARERLDALVLAVTAEWDRDRSWELDGARSPVAWLAHRAPVTRQEASTLVRTARHVATFDQTAKALDAGDITAGHATIAAQAAKHRQELHREHEDVILDAARSLPVAGFRSVMQHWKACADDAAADGPTGDDANYLDIATTFGGLGHVDGRFDPIATEALMDRLDALEPPDPTNGTPPPRTLAQRRAAALMRLVFGDRSPQVRIDVIVDVDTLAGRALTDPVRGCCEVVGYGPISPVLARTLACDAAIGRVLMQGDSEVLDLGRRTRLITPALRRVLTVRDRTCVEPGCDIPAHWCDGHHIVPWERHGPTTLENLELRCRRHHVAAHRWLEAEARTHPRRE
jgi:hypothetical protein